MSTDQGSHRSVDGSVLVAGVATEYMLTRNFGPRVGLHVFRCQRRCEQEPVDGHLGWNMNSVRAYGQLKF